MSDPYWTKQLQEFSNFVSGNSDLDYRDWQPTKWESLLRVARDLVDRCELNRNGPLDNRGCVLELGCGSATMLIQLASLGLQCTGVDISSTALGLAEKAADSLHITNRPKFLQLDFLNSDAVREMSRADLVFSIGTIEHFDREKQKILLDIHRRLSRKWVMIGIPNLESPVFRSFLKWAEKAGQLYPEEHIMYSIPDMASELGLKLTLTDGCHLFFGRYEYYMPGFPELDNFYQYLREKLLEFGGDKYSDFPYVDFHRDDIDILTKAESVVSPEERIRFGFLNYYLLEIEDHNA